TVYARDDWIPSVPGDLLQGKAELVSPDLGLPDHAADVQRGDPAHLRTLPHHVTERAGRDSGSDSQGAATLGPAGGESLMRSPLAIHGGSPVRTRAFTKWPVSGPEDVEAVARVLAGEKWGSGMYFGAEQASEVRRFEKRFAEYQQCRHGLGVANGTAALEIILRASSILPGDEVIVPDFTFIATATAVLQMGAV